MDCKELDSFVTKIKSLWHAGKKACLQVETENGQAFICLKAELGYVTPPPRINSSAGSSPYQTNSYRKRGPSYHRRQERRRLERKSDVASEEATGTEAEQAFVTPAKKEINTNVDVADQAATVVEVAETSGLDNMNYDKIVSENCVEVEDRFKCGICNFIGARRIGLQIHMKKVHEVGDQTLDEKYENPERFWRTGQLGTTYQDFLDANNLVDECEASQDVKIAEKELILKARKSAFGTDFMYFPPWNT